MVLNIQTKSRVRNASVITNCHTEAMANVLQIDTSITGGERMRHKGGQR